MSSPVEAEELAQLADTIAAALLALRPPLAVLAAVMALLFMGDGSVLHLALALIDAWLAALPAIMAAGVQQ